MFEHLRRAHKDSDNTTEIAIKITVKIAIEIAVEVAVATLTQMYKVAIVCFDCRGSGLSMAEYDICVNCGVP